MVLGIGDDAALVEPRAGQMLVLTSDLSIEGTHFTGALHPAEAVGHRALARSLSDIAAMGATPRFALISLALSRRVSGAWIKAFYAGVLRLAGRFGVVIAGGDTATGMKQTAVDVTVIGEAARAGVLLRSGARPGDSIFVAGELGLSARGLRLLKQKTRARNAQCRSAIHAHLYPEPQCALGTYLARAGLASAAIDVSDGLSTDLTRLAEASRVGACIESDRIPAPGNRSGDCRWGAISPVALALSGGEDYKLLFTVPEARARLAPGRLKGVRIYRIGEIREARYGIRIVRNGRAVPLKPSGYDHFR